MDITNRVHDKFIMLLYGVQIAQYGALLVKNSEKVSDLVPFLSTLTPCQLMSLVYSGIKDGCTI